MKVVLSVRDGGSKTPCKWLYLTEIYRRDKLGDPILADAICDRIIHDSYTIVIDCKDSMRKRKGISED